MASHATGLAPSEASQAVSVPESHKSTNSSIKSDQIDEKINNGFNANNALMPASHPSINQKASIKVSGDSESEESGSYDEDDEEEEEEELLPRAGFRDLFRYANRKDIFLNIIGIITACAAGAAQPLMTIVFGNLTTNFLRYTNSVGARSIAARSFESLYPSSNMLLGRYVATNISPADLEAARESLQNAINRDALLLVYIGAAIFATTYVYMATFVYTGEVITRRIREEYLAAVLRQEVAYFDSVGAGEITTRIQSEIQLIQDGISDKLPMSAMFVATFVAGFVVAYIKSWQLSLAMSSILPCIIGAGAAMNVFITKYQQIEMQYVAQAASVAEESLSSVRTVKAFAIEKKVVDLYNESNSETTKQGRKKAIVQGIGLGAFFFVIYASYSLAFFFGSKLLAGGHLESGTVMTTIFSIFIGSFSLSMLAPNLSALSYAMAAAGKVFETIDRRPQIDSSDPKGLMPDICHGIIEFRSVSFSYPARPNVPILKDFSLQIIPNQTTALVGASGSGKSTVVSLLERFYDADHGEVYLDGYNIQDLNLTWLRTQIGLVSQEAVLFSTTIRQNIEYGLINTPFEKISTEEKEVLIIDAAKQANAHEFISQLPSQYDTLVGEKGFLLSGGQKQRIAIARAIVGKPRILLLDESTSALDTRSEGLVQEALDRASKDRTVLVIAHRLSTIRNADKIVVFGKGIILEQGTHQDLLNNTNGPYARLVDAQRIRGRECIEMEEEKEKTFYQYGEALHGEEKRDAEEAEIAEMKLAAIEEQQRPSISIKKTISRQSVSLAPSKDNSDKQQGLFYLLFRLAKINSDYIWTLYIPGILGSLVSGAVYPAFSILFGRALETYSLCQGAEQMPCPEPQRSIMRHHSDLNALYFFIISLVATLAIGIQNGNLIMGASILMERLRSLTLKAMLRCDISYFDKERNSSGALTASLAENSQRISGLVGVTMGTILQSISTLIIGWIVALSASWRLALPMIATSPLTLSAGFSRLKLVVIKDQEIKAAHSMAAHRAAEAAASIRTVAALTKEKECLATYRQELKGPAQIIYRTAFFGNVLYALSQALAFPTIALGFWYGSHLLLDGKIEGGAFFQVLTATVFASIQAGNAFSFVTDISQAHVAADDSIRLVDNVPEIDSQSQEGMEMPQCEGRVTFEDVHFNYPTRSDSRVLRGVNLEAKPGTFIALVGHSGSGKSTAIQLIERFYDATRGRILIDGHDIRKLNLRSLRRHIALVSQEPILFAGTIGYNIALGAAGMLLKDEDEDDEDDEKAYDAMEKVTEQQLRKAARNANILTFIESLPDSFDTQVGGKGTQLSGGQKQRIAIARALIRDPKILLLDEATSSLDSESEQVVQAALDKASRGRTTISIAHRLSSISRADQIYCLNDGIICEQGNHTELMAKKGLYSELVGLQELQKDD